MSSLHIKKGDHVIVLSGADQGKKGKVITVIPKAGKVIVEGINMATKHRKPRGNKDMGGIIHQEAPIYAAKVMHVCNKCHMPTRIAYKLFENGDKVRVCKKCGDTFND